jgi:hypothetical protein
MAAGDPILAADYAGIRRGTIDGILCRVRQTVAQSVANNTDTPITMDVEDFDPFSLHSTSSNTARITPNVAGYYDVRGGAFLASTAAVWDAAIWKNGATQIPSGSRDTAGTATQSGRLAVAYVYCNGSTDYVELHVTQVTGAALNTNVSSRFSSWLELRYTGRATNP